MPRNHRHVPREEKKEALVLAATRLFLEEGYDNASMPKIARAAGVTSNSLYWYFEDKDDLFTAVGERHLERLTSEYVKVANKPLDEQFHWLIDAMRPVKSLVATAHARAPLSLRIERWDRAFHGRLEALFESRLEHALVPDERDAEVDFATFAIEGAIIHDLDDARTAKLCEAIAHRLLDRAQESRAGGGDLPDLTVGADAAWVPNRESAGTPAVDDLRRGE